MALILDTNALSALAEGNKELEKAIRGQNQLCIPVIVLGEFRFGIGQSRFEAQYERWLKLLLPEVRVLPVADLTASYYAMIRKTLKLKGQPIPSNDLWIAALAKEYGFPLVTKDAHFSSVSDIRVVSW